MPQTRPEVTLDQLLSFGYTTSRTDYLPMLERSANFRMRATGRGGRFTTRG